MEEGRMKEIEEMLHQLIFSSNKSQDENQHSKFQPDSANVIRRRKGSPDLKVS